MSELRYVVSARTKDMPEEAWSEVASFVKESDANRYTLHFQRDYPMLIAKATPHCPPVDSVGVDAERVREIQKYSIMGVIAADGTPTYQYTTDNPDGEWVRSSDLASLTAPADGCEGCWAREKDVRQIDRFACSDCRRPRLRVAMKARDYYSPSESTPTTEGDT